MANINLALLEYPTDYTEFINWKNRMVILPYQKVEQSDTKEPVYEGELYVSEKDNLLKSKVWRKALDAVVTRLSKLSRSKGVTQEMYYYKISEEIVNFILTHERVISTSGVDSLFEEIGISESAIARKCARARIKGAIKGRPSIFKKTADIDALIAQGFSPNIARLISLCDNTRLPYTSHLIIHNIHFSHESYGDTWVITDSQTNRRLDTFAIGDPIGNLCYTITRHLGYPLPIQLTETELWVIWDAICKKHGTSDPPPAEPSVEVEDDSKDDSST